MKNLKIVILDNPYSNWNDPFVRDFFGKIVNLKKKGFASRFDSSYAPVDKSDFHCTHLCLCTFENDELTPICSYRAISKDRSDQYGFKFPGLSVCDSTGSQEHKEALSEFVNSCEIQNQKVAYYSSFAIDPNLRGEIRKEAIIFIFPVLAFYMIHWEVDKGIAIGSCKTKTDDLYHKTGLLPINLKGEELGSLVIPASGNEEFEVQALESLSDYCIEKAQEKMELWNDRVHVFDNSKQFDNVKNHFKKSTKPKLKKAA